jgi:hypothetical protein
VKPVERSLDEARVILAESDVKFKTRKDDQMKIRTIAMILVMAVAAMALYLHYESAAVVHAASCFAICAHSSHGSVGWTGPIRTGVSGSADAQKDADAHNKANPGHEASGSCN